MASRLAQAIAWLISNFLGAAAATCVVWLGEVTGWESAGVWPLVVIYAYLGSVSVHVSALLNKSALTRVFAALGVVSVFVPNIFPDHRPTLLAVALSTGGLLVLEGMLPGRPKSDESGWAKLERDLKSAADGRVRVAALTSAYATLIGLYRPIHRWLENFAGTAWDDRLLYTVSIFASLFVFVLSVPLAFLGFWIYLAALGLVSAAIAPVRATRAARVWYEDVQRRRRAGSPVGR